MAFVAGDRCASSRVGPGTAVLAFPKNFVLFGTIIAPAANVIWDNGILAGTQAAALERIDYLAPVYKRVKPIATTSPEYTGIVVGHYNRQVNGNGAVSGPFYLIKLLNGAGYMELLVSDTEEVS